MSFGLLSAALAALMGMMALAFGVQRLLRNSGWVDTIWTLGTGLVIACAVVLAAPYGLRAWGIALLVLLWAARLGSHIASRSLKGGDDPRYAALEAAWGEKAPLRMFLFLQSQALASFVLAVSALAAASNPAPPGLVDLLAGVVALVAIFGEHLADRQLAAAKRAGEAIAERGLWRYSRHPNYFFEFLFWCALPLFALSGGANFWLLPLAVLARAQMYYLLNHVSGLPPLEAHMLRRHGAAFAAYQRRVNAFFPGPRHEESITESQRSTP